MRTRRVVLPSACTVLAAVAGLALGQDRHWVGGADLSWNNPLNWSPADVPNTFTENAMIDANGSYMVLLSGSIPVGSLSLTQGLGQLGLAPGAGLQLAGNVSNMSTILINTSGTAVDTTVQLVGSSVFSGAGALVLNAHPSNSNTGRIAYYTGGETLTNTATHTIEGNGIIQVGLDNQGVLDANHAGKALTISGGTKGNSGTMRATGGGVLQLAANIANTVDGRITADGGNVEIYGVTISGGQLSGVNAGHVQCVANNTTLVGVNTSGAIDVIPGHGLSIPASFINTGTITVNPDGTAADSWINATGSFTLDGDGQLVLNAHPSNSNTGAIGWYTGAEVVTNSASHTIRGTGRIMPALVNEGTISADQSAKALYLTNNTKQNNNLIRAINGASLEVMASVNQGPGGRIVAQDAAIHFYDVALVSGLVDTTDLGIAQAVGNPTFTNVTMRGPFQVMPGHTLAAAGTLAFHDTLVLNPGAAIADTWLSAVTTLTLSGGGTLVLSANQSNLNTAGITHYTGTEVVTNAAGNTISGSGRIYAQLVNEGVVNANASATAMLLDGGAKTNNNLITATNASTLNVASGINQGTSGRLVADNATINLGDVTVSGGQLQAINAGLIQVVGNTNLPAFKLQGPLNVAAGHTLWTSGVATHTGTIRVNPAGAAADTWVVLNADATLSGDGELVLNAHSSNLNTGAIGYYTGAETLTNSPTHTIRGTGRIATTLVNNGVVLADQPGKILAINTRPVVNNNLIQSFNGAQLDVSVPISGPGQMVAANATLRFLGGSVTGQHVSSTGTGLVGVYGTTAFGDVTFDGRVDVQPGVSMQIAAPGITNNATLRVNPSAQASDTSLALLASARFEGSGQVLLNANPSNYNTGAIGWYTGAEVLTNGHGHTLAGTGLIYPTLVSEGTLSPGTDDGAGTLLGSNRAWTLANPGTLAIDLFGESSYDRVVTSGPVTVGGQLLVRHAASYPGRTGATFTIVHAAAIVGHFDYLPPAVNVVYTPTDVILLDACHADLDDGSGAGQPDGGVDVNDLLYFITQYSLGYLGADLDDGSMSGTPDQAVTIEDLLFFLAHYEGGC